MANSQESTRTATPRTMIRLDRVRKRYAGQAADAVAPLSMDIGAGEFVVFVGPSGCGKTTTLRMINRLVEPTDGRILLDGADVTRSDPTQLRRRIGYVIQQVGLIPHMTVAANVGLVPRLLGWDRPRIDQRVRELLDLVGLDAATFARRYPQQLSGGQQQRVGVARALAADPPVMLMDEPFGAIDPVTRYRLQQEFLGLQRRIRKTVVFVTHDINEALRLGDRIAIFAENSRLAQFGTPLEILSSPADDYVRSFIGSGAAIRRLALLRTGSVAATLPSSHEIRKPSAVAVSPDATVYDAVEAMLQAGTDQALVDLGEEERIVTLSDMLLTLPVGEAGPR